MPEPAGGIYRTLSAEMREGLKNIFRQISKASAEEKIAGPEELFTETSTQLNEVVRATENAAMDIMDIVEKQLANTEQTRALLAKIQEKHGDSPELAELAAHNVALATDLTSVLTSLSFQDITGQRIKKVMKNLAALEESVVELYLSSGLVMEAAEKNPEADSGAIRAEAEKAMEDYRENRAVQSELKGPDSKGASQAAIDEMLAQLGL